MDLYLLLEIFSVVLLVIYTVLMMKENIWCWIFGIGSSVLWVLWCINTKYYSESLLYLFYAVAGVYGWYRWKKPNKDTQAIQKLNPKRHALWILILILLALVVGYIFNRYTDAQKSYIDAFTTVFGFYATFLEAHKKIEAWLYWIVLNAISIWLYFIADGYFMGTTMIGMVALSYMGYRSWYKKLQLS